MAKEVKSRSSEGVRAQLFPRTDFPQQGWIGKAAGAGTYYEAISGFGWWSETQSFRSANRDISHGPRAKQHDYYQTNPQQGWMGKPVLTLFDRPDQQDWQIKTVRTATHLRYQRDTNSISSWNVFVPAANDWHVDTVRTASNRRYQRDANTDNAWIVTVSTATFDPALQDWHTDTVQTKRRLLDQRYYQTAPDLAWLSNAGIIQQDWQIETVRTFQAKPRAIYTGPDLGWLTLAAFDTAIQDWQIDTIRTSERKRNALPYQTGHDLGWITVNVPVVFNPATQDWQIETARMAPGARYLLEKNVDVSWITENLSSVSDTGTVIWIPVWVPRRRC